jgi:hypothetical protein
MRTQTNYDVGAFRVGDRVQAHPATEISMQGDRYGTVAKIGRPYVTVRMDVSGRLLRFAPRSLVWGE